MISYFQALIMGLLQGVSELFPVSSLGHSVLVAWVLNWHSILAAQTSSESFFISFLVMLHVGTAIALLIFYRKVWARIIKGFFKSISRRRIDNPDARLAWLLIVATVPAGLTALIFQSLLRSQFAKPLSAIVFLFINGLILLIGDHYQKQQVKSSTSSAVTISDHVSGKLTLPRAAIIGTAQVGALFAGISRSGITMVSGLFSGLNHEDSARFSFLLATPIILSAGIYNLGDFFSNLDSHVRGQLIFGGIMAGISAYVAVRFLDKYFQNKTLRPFAYYCMGISIVLLGLGLIRGHF